jgi:hypothetical protein
MAPVLQVRDATKRFPGVLANDHVSFSLNEGEIKIRGQRTSPRRTSRRTSPSFPSRLMT